MSNMIVVPDSFRAVANHGPAPIDDNLTAGISSSFGVVSIQGGKFRIKFAGVETPLLDARGNSIPELNVVIVGASPYVSRTYYAGGFEANAGKAPTCSSLDGKFPDVTVENPPARSCATCPHALRDQVTPTGAKVSACQNNKRIAIVPEGDLENEQFGGPMLLRIPGGSLKNLTALQAAYKGVNCASYQAVTALRFDPMVSYPKMVFAPERRLRPEEQEVIDRMRSDGSLDAILSVSERSDEDEPAIHMPASFSNPQPAATSVVAPQPIQRAAPIVAVATLSTDEAKPATIRRRPATKSQIAQAVEKPVVVAPPSSFEADLDAKLNSIL